MSAKMVSSVGGGDAMVQYNHSAEGITQDLSQDLMLGLMSSVSPLQDHLNLNQSLADTLDPFLNNSHFSERDVAEICGSLQKYMRFRIVVDIFVVSFFILGGLVGNTLAFFVMRVDNTNNTVSFLLQALAVVDNLYLVLCIFMQVLKALNECTDWIPGLQYTYPFLEPYIWPLTSIVQTTGVWLVVIVTFDRYIAICHPFNTAYKGTRSKARKATFIIIILAILYNIPRFFEHQTTYTLERCSNTMRYVTVHSALRTDRVYFIVYKTILYFLFRVVIPLATLTVLNTKLILVLRGATKSHAVLTRTAPPRSDPFTRILVAVVTVFLICELPTFIVRAAVTIRAFSSLQFSLWYPATLSNLLLTVNSSINCVVYCISGPRFRMILRKIFRQMCNRGAANDTMLYGEEEQSNLNGTLTTMSQRRSTVRKPQQHVPLHNNQQQHQQLQPQQHQHLAYNCKEHYKVDIRDGTLCRTTYQDTTL